ncbi:Gfo/Idh/MocA family protein [Actinocatenispora comari]|uniref:Oxidoreductase n=1 Tax=Actinocatenispora comari TaxID=2807577 RepID=A0A8J4ALJ8_9ACTN|nr:Gfo/Idh/MocA family oxidoreductase [Actinocatenispora comari]GIL31670.1 oxidoreductase [Actinocatenispora comari]
MRKIRWGILATGGIAATFTEDLLTMPDAEVVAVGSRSVEAARLFADRYDIPRAYGSWAELAADGDVDVVYVATPHSAHHAAAAACLDAGKAVLVEKPAALSAPQAEDLVARARAAGVLLVEAMWTRTLPAVRELTARIAAGAIGTPRVVSADFGLTGEFAPTHRLRDPALGGGALLDLGVYPVAFAQLVLGEPATVTATGTRTAEGVDETVGLLLGHDSGAVATLTCSIAADTPRVAAVSGDAGRIELDRGFFAPHGFRLYRGTHVEQVTAAPSGRGYVHEAAEVMRCLRAGETDSPLLPLADTLAVLRTLDAARAQLGVRYPAE